MLHPTNSRRGLLSITQNRFRSGSESGFADDAESHELPVGEPPAALGELGIRFLPFRGLAAAGSGSDPRRGIEKSAAAEDRLAVQIVRPLAGIAQHVAETQLVRQL